MENATGPKDYNAQELRSFVTFRISRTYAELNRQAQKTLSQVTRLTLSQWRIISVIAFETNATAAAISNFTDLDKGQISRAVKKLIEYGFVSRRSEIGDKRRQILELTPEGRAEHARVLRRMRKRQIMLVDGIPNEELQTFLRVLKEIERNAKEDVE